MILNNTVMIEDVMRQIRLSELTMVAGFGKSGKTDFVVEMAKCAVKEGKQKVLFFSLEHEKEELINKYIGREELFDIDDTPRIVVTEVENKCRACVQNYGLKMVFIDYFLLMEPSVPRCSRVEELKANIEELNVIAKELNIAIVVVAPLIHYGKCRRPDVFDLREYGFPIEDMVDLILFIWREAGTYEITIYHSRADGGRSVV